MFIRTTIHNGAHRMQLGKVHPPVYLSFTQLRFKLGGRGRTTVYRDVENGRLPKPLKLGSRLYWIESEVDELLSANHR